MNRILLLLIISLFSLFPCFAQKSKILSNADRERIIKEILGDTNFLENEVALNESKDTVNLSKKNLFNDIKPLKIKGLKFQLFTPEEVEEKSKDGFGYYVFAEFRIKASKIIISFENYWVNGQFFISGRTDYEYRKVSGKWKRIKKMLRPNAIS
jgi:hypothetical protein